MQRRDFLKSTAASVAALSAAPMILGADDKSGSKNPTVGKGEFTYECIHNWGQLPDKFEWQTTHGVAIDQDGLVYIKMQGHGGKPAVDTIYVFDKEGKLVRSFGKEIHPGGHG